jgi:hypothetical protein
MEAGAFGAHTDHDAHILSTLSSIQILTIHDALDRVDVPRVVQCKCDDLRPHCNSIAYRMCITPVRYPVSSTAFWRVRGRLLWRDRHTIFVLRNIGAFSTWTSRQAG